MTGDLPGWTCPHLVQRNTTTPPGTISKSPPHAEQVPTCTPEEVSPSLANSSHFPFPQRGHGGISSGFPPRKVIVLAQFEHMNVSSFCWTILSPLFGYVSTYDSKFKIILRGELNKVKYAGFSKRGLKSAIT